MKKILYNNKHIFSQHISRPYAFTKDKQLQNLLSFFSLFSSLIHTSSKQLRDKAINEEESNLTFSDENTVSDVENTVSQVENKPIGYIYTNNKSLWHSYFSNQHYDEISMEILKKELQCFIDLYKTQYNQKYFAIMFKVKFDNGDIRSASKVQISSTDKKHIEKLYWALASVFKFKALHMILSEMEEIEFFSPVTGLPKGNIFFSFKPMKNVNKTKFEHLDAFDDKFTLDNDHKKKKNPIHSFKFNGFEIPSTMDLSLWPNINFFNDYRKGYASIDKKLNGETIPLCFIIDISDYSIETCVLFNQKLNLTIKDESLNFNKDLSTFKRTINEDGNEKIFHFESGRLVFYQEKLKTKFMNTIKKDVLNLDNPKLLTLDLETRAINNLPTNINDKPSLNFIPIVMSIYNGKTFNNYIFTQENWENEMMKGFKSIMMRKYDGYHVYTHNFSHFDSIFIIDILSRLGEVKPFIRDGKILKLTFKFKLPNSTRSHTLYFMDSLLILPNSLDKLSKSFNISNKKSFFPHSFLDNPEISLNYKGKCPEYKYFPKAYTNEFKYELYQEYSNKFDNNWNLKKELVDYCKNDVLALYQILMKFRENIYMKFQINIMKYPTIPSLAFAIFRSNFMKPGQIPIIQSKLHRIIKQSYYGGITENYKARGWNIKSYDVNSLYPHSMKINPMPTGNPIYVKGDLKQILKLNPSKSDNIPFGFYNVKVIAPQSLDKPFLPKRINSPDGIRTIYPLGEWTGFYFSEEIINAMKYGYKFEFIEGYLFEKSFLFIDYINILYEIKKSVNKDDPWYYISKLLMNSLYGRFGLNPEGVNVLITSEEKADEIIINEKNVSITPLLSKNVMVSYEKDEDSFNNMQICVPISSAIAAYSRITMSHFMYKYSKNLYYIDTDGIKIDNNLDINEIDDKELGKMKYEYKLNEFVAIGPKAYGGVILNEDNNLKELVKLKGYNSSLHLNTLKEALNRNNHIILNQKKWLRKLSLSTILVTESEYTLSLTMGKREPVFNPWGDLVGTIPFKLEDDKIIRTGDVPSNLYYLKNPSSLFV